MWQLNMKSGAAVLTSLLVLQGCNQSEKIDERTLPTEVVPGSFVVELKDLSDSNIQSDEYLLDLGQQIAVDKGCEASIEKISWERGSQVLSTNLYNSYHFELSGCELDLESSDQVLISLLDDDAVLNAEANAVVRTSLSENDQYKNRQYYLDNIRRDSACDLSGKQGKPVVVAVVDSGVQKTHPDLKDRFYRNKQGQVIGANFVGKGSSRSPDSNWDDDNGHGTHVAGLIGASANNSIGIAGVGACQNVLIMPVRVMNSRGQGSSLEIDRGVQWAAANGADIINLSLGSNSISRVKKSSHRKSLYENLNDQGVIVFAAAGNDGFRNGSSRSGGYVYSYPASYNHVIAVGATDQNNRLTNFSVYGDHIDIAAPGANALSTYPGSSYKSLSGTSMATPIAVGTYALGLSAVRSKGNEGLFHDELVDLLKQSANTQVRFPREDIIAGGLVDAKAILLELQKRFPDDGRPTEPNPVDPTPTDPTKPDPTEPTDPEPAPEPAPETGGFSFVGLEEGQAIGGVLKLTVSGWPEGTARINLYWITGYEWFPRAFTSLGSQNLNSAGTAVTTDKSYLLYGTRYLVAEAVDSRGRRLKVESIVLQGL